MSLPTPAPRQKLHRREILIEGFQRDDGNLDIDAWLTDTKTVAIDTDRRLLEPGAGDRRLHRGDGRHALNRL